MAEPFFTDGMTVDEILDLSDEILSKLSARDMSRALRTVSLAANKRINRLMDNAVLKKGEFIQKKSAKQPIALDALNVAYEMQGKPSKNNLKFSGKGLTRNEQYAEFARARYFMKLKTSKVSAAKEVFTDRTERIFGKSINAMIDADSQSIIDDYMKTHGRMPTEKQLGREYTKREKEYYEISKDAWSNYRKFLENNDIQSKYYGSDEVIALIGQRTAESAVRNLEFDEEAVFNEARKKKEHLYIDHQKEEAEKHRRFMDQYVHDNAVDMGEDF